MTHRDILCCEKCQRPTLVLDGVAELIEQPDGSFIMGYTARSSCCVEGVEYKPACDECHAAPATCEDMCNACAATFYVENPDEWEEANEFARRWYPLVHAAVMARTLRYIGQSEVEVGGGV